MENIISKKKAKKKVEDSHVNLYRAFAEDNHPNKVDLGCAIFRNDDGKVWIQPHLREVEMLITQSKERDNNELDPLGDRDYCKATQDLVFGPESPVIQENLVLTVQTLGCTGALRIAAEFIYQSLKYETVYVSVPTWQNYVSIFQAAGITDVREYRYLDKKDYTIDLQGMLDDLSGAPKNSVVTLQVCAHNPTAVDLKMDEWLVISDVIMKRELFPLFDMSYHGLASANLCYDAEPVRIFAQEGIEMMVAYSFVKNFVIYSKRIGALMVTMKDKKCKPAIKSHLNEIIKSLYGSPPSRAMMIIKTVLNDQQLFTEWKNCLRLMKERIDKLRNDLATKVNLEHKIANQKGMFCNSGFSKSQVEYLVFYYHIYLLKNGRINLTGINSNNMDYVFNAMRKAIRNYQ